MPREPAIGEPTLEESIQLIYERIHDDLLDFAADEILESLTWSKDPEGSRKAQDRALKRVSRVVGDAAAKFAEALAKSIEDELDRWEDR